jgi:hypothetical protein
MIESLDLLTKNEIFEQGGTTLSGTETILIFDRAAYVGRHEGIIVVEIILRQKLLCGCGSVAIGSIATVELAGHVGTGRIGDANEACDKRETHS